VNAEVRDIEFEVAFSAARGGLDAVGIKVSTFAN
jgi:hypothetical protein